MTDQQATMPTVTGKYHPAALLLPEMSEQEYRELVEDIREHGQREPISKDRDGLILDGRHRWRACQELGIEPRIIRHVPPLEGAELEAWKVAFVISRNVHRRHLTTQQRAAIGAELAKMKSGARTDLASSDAMSDAQAAKLMKVSEPSIERAKRRMRTDPIAHAKAKAGTLPRKQPLSEPQRMRREWDAVQKQKRPEQRPDFLDALLRLTAVLSAIKQTPEQWAATVPESNRADIQHRLQQGSQALDRMAKALFDMRHPAPEPVEKAQPDDEWTIRGARIREARKAKGLTGKELAMMANVLPNIVSMCEHAKLSKSGGPAAGRPAYAKLEAALGIADA